MIEIGYAQYFCPHCSKQLYYLRTYWVVKDKLYSIPGGKIVNEYICDSPECIQQSVRSYFDPINGDRFMYDLKAEQLVKND